MIDLKSVIKNGIMTTHRDHIRERLSNRHHFLRLDLNENLLKLQEEDYNNFINSLTPDALSAYPDLSDVYRKMAAFMQVSEDQIVIANGSDLAIKCIFDACIEKGDHIVIHDPCFLMYEIYANFFEAEIDKVSVKPDWTPDVSSMLDRIKPNTKLVIFEAPSGYLGAKPDVNVLENIAGLLEQKNILLIIDEAYLYVNDNESDYINLVNKFSNIILLRTMSKAFGLAGARVGVLISNNAIVNELYKIRPLYEISALSALAATWRLNHLNLLDQYQRVVRDSKKLLFQELNDIGVEYKDTFANFIIVKFPDTNEKDFFALMRDYGVLIGKKYTLPMLKGWWRVAVGDLNHSKTFVSKIKNILKSEVL